MRLTEACSACPPTCPMLIRHTWQHNHNRPPPSTYPAPPLGPPRAHTGEPAPRAAGKAGHPERPAVRGGSFQPAASFRVRGPPHRQHLLQGASLLLTATRMPASTYKCTLRMGGAYRCCVCSEGEERGNGRGRRQQGTGRAAADRLMYGSQHMRVQPEAGRSMKRDGARTSVTAPASELSSAQRTACSAMPSLMYSCAPGPPTTRPVSASGGHGAVADSTPGSAGGSAGASCGLGGRLSSSTGLM